MLPIIKTVLTALSALHVLKEVMVDTTNNYTALSRSEYDIAMTVYAGVREANQQVDAVKVSHNQLAIRLNTRFNSNISGHELNMMWHGQITREELPEVRV